MRTTRDERATYLMYRLLEWREQWHLTQAEAAQHLCVSLRTLQRWENRETCPDLEDWAWVILNTRADVNPKQEVWLLELRDARA